jgi:exopolyphosphatase/guanosine-5'-triphosphate,3'-diphosphate pyrophosphatase
VGEELEGRQRALDGLGPQGPVLVLPLAAVNSSTLGDGITLDLGGGSLQLVQVVDRTPRAARSWRLGAVVMTERFLPDKRVKPKQLKALRAHVRAELAAAPWALGAGQGPGRRMTGIGGTVRNLAAAAQLAAGLPSYGVQGFALTREAVGALVDRLAELTPAERGRVPGIKPERGDLILAGAVVVEAVMALAGFDALEATEAGLREGVFYETLLAGTEPPLLADVRGAAVRNLAAQYHADRAHTEHVARLALEMWDALAAAGVHPGRPDERELLWAAAMLHDIGTAVDYDDHHKHSRYLILNAHLPGHTPRETALVGQMARYHRKGVPTLGEFARLARPGDDALLTRCAAILRLAEQLERSRDQSVRHARMHVDGTRAELALEADEDTDLARWAAARQRELFQRAFARDLVVR